MGWRLIKGVLARRAVVVGPSRAPTFLSRHTELFGRGKAAGPHGRSSRLARLLWRPAYLRRVDGRRGAGARLPARERAALPDGVRRRVGQGRLAEFPGPRGLGVDKFIRTLGFYREAESSFSALSPWAQKRLEAYADGVNAFLDSHKDGLSPEFLIVGDRPSLGTRRFAGLGQVDSLQLSHNY